LRLDERCWPGNPGVPNDGTGRIFIFPEEAGKSLKKKEDLHETDR